MILVVTRKRDAHGAHILELLRHRGEDALALDYETYPQQLEIGLRSTDSGEELKFRFPDGSTVEGASVKSVLNRRQAEPRVSQDIRDQRISDYVVRESRNFLDALPQMLRCFWLSDPDSVRIASRKPYHFAVARQIGFVTPPTVVGNSSAEVAEFVAAGATDIACKALWTPGITVERDSKETGIALYTQRIKAGKVLEGLPNVHNCPMIFQAYVEKAFELRITVVGRQVFTCAIHSQKSQRTREDWRRYDLANTPHDKYDLPVEIGEMCIRLVEALGLSFGCIDMIVTPAGEHVFLEINPNGQWLWIEHLTGMPISEAIVELLVHPPKQALRSFR